MMQTNERYFPFLPNPYTHTHTHTHKLTTQTLACIDETRANTHISCMHKCTHTHTHKRNYALKKYPPTSMHTHTHKHNHTHTHILSNSLSLCGNKIHTTALPLNVLCYRTQTHTNTHKHTANPQINSLPPPLRL